MELYVSNNLSLSEFKLKKIISQLNQRLKATDVARAISAAPLNYA